jgi:hypothetical protein
VDKVKLDNEIMEPLSIKGGLMWLVEKQGAFYESFRSQRYDKTITWYSESVASVKEEGVDLVKISPPRRSESGAGKKFGNGPKKQIIPHYTKLCLPTRN